MTINFGRDICGTLATAESREWLVTNGVGGYACGTIAGVLTRRYHGLLIAATKPPLGRSLMLAKLDEVAQYQQRYYPLYANRWVDDIVDPDGHQHIESFQLEGTIPCWTFACADALLEKRIWMQPSENTTYIHYTLRRASRPLKLKLKALVNYRDHHSSSQSRRWQMEILPFHQGISISAFPSAPSLYLHSDRGKLSAVHDWYHGFELARERDRGLDERDDHLHAATLEIELEPGEAFTVIASTQRNVNLDGHAALEFRRSYEQDSLQQWNQATVQSPSHPDPSHQPPSPPAWIQQLVLAADQFIVNRPLEHGEPGKTILAGYPWYGDWGRHAMISLPGLTLTTGRFDVARSLLLTFAHYLDQGMIPNVFPDLGDTPAYNSVDASLWFVEAVHAYYKTTGDGSVLPELFPALAAIIDSYRYGTRYTIQLDPNDGLLYAGETGLQLTWMDAKISEWVVTPRTGKPIEVNALWYNALRVMAQIAQRLGKPDDDYTSLAEQTAQGFERFWNPDTDYCFDVLDGPSGNDPTLRPNQILAISLPEEPDIAPLLTADQRKAIVDCCSQTLLTSYGLRSLPTDHPNYRGRYEGDQVQRDMACHQGTVWGWLIGPFVRSHLKVYGNPAIARSFLEPMSAHLQSSCVGSLSEMFDGDAPLHSRGAFAHAGTVAEVLRTWMAIAQHETR